MQAIEIIENQNNIWNKLIAENKSECFLQSWEWGEFQKSAGKKIRRLAVFDRNKIAALALIIKNDLSFFGNYLYCPRGPVFEKPNTKNQIPKIYEILFSKIKDIAQSENCFFLKIDPPIESNYELRITNYDFLNKFKKSAVEIQPKNTLMLDLSKLEKSLMAEMKQKTRYNIRLAEKKGVKIRISSDIASDFPKFWNLIEETSKRNEISSHSKEYYFKMLESLKENADTGQSKLSSRLYLAEYNGNVIASNMVLFFSDLAVYLHGASSDENKNVMAPYLLQWKQILDAKELGCRKYDFWGITADGEKESWAGITRFKKGFGGFEKRYIGAMDLVFDRSRYFGYKLLRKARNIL